MSLKHNDRLVSIRRVVTAKGTERYIAKQMANGYRLVGPTSYFFGGYTITMTKEPANS